MKQLSRTREKTRQRFIDVFFAVRKAKPVDKITVRDIVTEAGYNRSSFYLYYADVYDLADSAENSIIDQMSEDAENEFPKDGDHSLESFMSRLALQISEYADKIQILSDSRSFREKYMNVLRPNFARASGIDPIDRSYDYLVSLFFSIMLHNITYWAQHKEEYTLPEIAELTREIFLPGVRQLRDRKETRGPVMPVLPPEACR